MIEVTLITIAVFVIDAALCLLTGKFIHFGMGDSDDEEGF